MKNKKILFVVILLIVLASSIFIMKKPPSLGLDLVGGTRLLLEAQTTESIKEITPQVMDSLQYSIDRRINALGVAETTVQKTGDRRLIVEIPNVSDPEKARAYVGETAELEFKEPVYDSNHTVVDWKSTGLTGKNLRSATFNPDSQKGGYAVSLEFDAEGAKMFADLTARLVHQPMAIFFNGELQSAPEIQSVITGGQAQITGGGNGFNAEQAKEMVDYLNAGALPVPAEIIEETIVGPTLGSDSLHKSLVAGILGIALVWLYMLYVYRAPGLIADIALAIYAIILFAAFGLFHVTLTLAGIAGFILSVGMAVDANILIFERTKEELRSGRTLFTAINSGFDRAFTSIFDSNMTTIITCAILYFLGTSIVKGFALTLAIGVALSMFSAITVTKNFMHLAFGTGNLKHPWLFGLKDEEIGEGYAVEETKREKAKFGVLD